MHDTGWIWGGPSAALRGQLQLEEGHSAARTEGRGAGDPFKEVPLVSSQQPSQKALRGFCLASRSFALQPSPCLPPEVELPLQPFCLGGCLHRLQRPGQRGITGRYPCHRRGQGQPLIPTYLLEDVCAMGAPGLVFKTESRGSEGQAEGDGSSWTMRKG